MGQAEKMAARLLEVMPNAALSRAFGAVADVPLPAPLQGKLNRSFARAAGIDIEEAERAPESYRSLNAFFTRRLREGARPICRDPQTLVSPVDGRVAEFGRIERDTLVQAKGRVYSVSELLTDATWTRRVRGGSYITIYLSPRDYHRIHTPAEGKVLAMRYVPGRLLPVNRLGVQYIDDLFPRNERLITLMQTPEGRAVAVVKVGATCVGRISVTYDDFMTNKKAIRRGFERDYGRPPHLERGAELGAFHLGSTVVVLFEGDTMEWDAHIEPGAPMRVGQRMARW